MTDFNADFGPGHTAPQAIDAEEAVLGCILINPDAFFEVAPFLKPDDFYLHKHRWVWDAIVRLHDQRLPVDTLTLTEELERHSQLAEVGGTAYLARLINSVPTSLHAEAYGRIVEREATRRRLMEAATIIAKLASEDGRNIDEVVNDAEATVFAVSERKLTKDITPMKEAISAYYDRIKYISEHGHELLGVPTGFVDLDKLLGGLQKSDLLIIAGRPGSGKTGFMLNVAKNAAQTYHKHVAVFSLEMSNEQLVQRMMSQETGIESNRLRRAELRDEEWPLFVQAASVMSEAQVFLDDTPGITPTQLRAKCRRLDQEFGLDLVIVDYLQLMQGERRNENRVQEVSDISRKLKLLARELNVPVLAGAQLSRAVEQRGGDKKPILSDLRESGSLEQDSDIVMFIHRPDLYETDVNARTNVAEIIVAKHRNGPTASIQLVFRGSLTKFENAETRQVVLE
jgi:replicative DNA helicase